MRVRECACVRACVRVRVHAACARGTKSFNMFFQRVNDFLAESGGDGHFTETAPYVGIADSGLGGRAGPIEWGTVVPYLAYQIYAYYGDMRVLQQAYPGVQAFVQLILNVSAPNYFLENGLGDFGALDAPSKQLACSAFVIFNLDLAARIAITLGIRINTCVHAPHAYSHSYTHTHMHSLTRPMHT